MQEKYLRKQSEIKFPNGNKLPTTANQSPPYLINQRYSLEANPLVLFSFLKMKTRIWQSEETYLDGGREVIFRKIKNDFNDFNDWKILHVNPEKKLKTRWIQFIYFDDWDCLNCLQDLAY